MLYRFYYLQENDVWPNTFLGTEDEWVEYSKDKVIDCYDKEEVTDEVHIRSHAMQSKNNPFKEGTKEYICWYAYHAADQFIEKYRNNNDWICFVDSLIRDILEKVNAA